MTWLEIAKFLREAGFAPGEILAIVVMVWFHRRLLVLERFRSAILATVKVGETNG